MANIAKNKSKMIVWKNGTVNLEGGILDDGIGTTVLGFNPTGSVTSFQSGRPSFANTLTVLEASKGYLISAKTDISLPSNTVGFAVHGTNVVRSVTQSIVQNVNGGDFNFNSSTTTKNPTGNIVINPNDSVAYSFRVSEVGLHSFWLVTEALGNWDCYLDTLQIANNQTVTPNNEINFSYNTPLQLGVYSLRFKNRSNVPVAITRVKIANVEPVQGSGSLGAKRFYFLGNSITDGARNPGIVQLVASQGGTHTWGRQVIPGATLAWLRNNPNTGFSESPFGTHPTALGNYQWDGIVFQPFDRPVVDGANDGTTESDSDSIKYFINQSLAQSPNATLYIYQRWRRKDLGDTNADNYNSNWNSPYNPNNFQYEKKAFYEALITQIKNDHPTRTFRIVPVGEVYARLNTKMKAGEVPGYTNIYDIYDDGIHTNSVGAYIASLTFISVMYGITPVGFPVTSLYGTIPDPVKTIIQETIREVVATTPDTGITSFPGYTPTPSPSPSPTPTPSGGGQPYTLQAGDLPNLKTSSRSKFQSAINTNIGSKNFNASDILATINKANLAIGFAGLSNIYSDKPATTPISTSDVDIQAVKSWSGSGNNTLSVDYWFSPRYLGDNIGARFRKSGQNRFYFDGSFLVGKPGYTIISRIARGNSRGGFFFGSSSYEINKSANLGYNLDNGGLRWVRRSTPTFDVWNSDFLDGSAIPFTTPVWDVVVARQNATGKILRRNGTQVASENTVNVLTEFADGMIGGMWNGGQSFTGYISDVLVFDSALSDSEIEQVEFLLSNFYTGVANPPLLPETVTPSNFVGSSPSPGVMKLDWDIVGASGDSNPTGYQINYRNTASGWFGNDVFPSDGSLRTYSYNNIPSGEYIARILATGVNSPTSYVETTRFNVL